MSGYSPAFCVGQCHCCIDQRDPKGIERKTKVFESNELDAPEEQRSLMHKKASKAFAGVSETAFTASENLSNSCATTCKDSGLAEHVPNGSETV